MKAKLSLEEFRRRARRVHSNRYIYDEVKYVNYHTKVKIFDSMCKNFFEQTPASHLKGEGCPCNSLKATNSLDLVGKVYGRLTVIREVGRTSKNLKMYKCSCSCGGSKVVTTSSLTSYGTKSCGCLRAEAIRERTFTDLTGNVYGFLKVIEKASYKKGKGQWKCLCLLCNEYTVSSSADMKKGKVRSCGCKRLSITERLVQKAVKKEFPYLKVDCNSFPNFLQGLQYDIFLPEVSLAIEIDGEQHFKYMEWIHKCPENFNLQRKRDRKKDKLSKSNGITLLRYREEEIRLKYLEVEEVLEDIEDYLDSYKW